MKFHLLHFTVSTSMYKEGASAVYSYRPRTLLSVQKIIPFYVYPQVKIDLLFSTVMHFLKNCLCIIQKFFHKQKVCSEQFINNI